MTREELAEICATAEAAIRDVYVEYEWDREPCYTATDITGQVVAIPIGPRKLTWATARPFTDRFLFVESTEWTDDAGRRYHVAETRSYNGEMGKRLEVTRDSIEGKLSMRGILTRSRRFILPGSTTPQHFTLLRFLEERPDYPLSKALRNTEWVDLTCDIEHLGAFRTIRTDFYAEGIRDKQGDRVRLSRIYFSVDHGCAPVQFELFNLRKMVTRDVVAELAEAAPGIWYPRKARSTTYNEDGAEHTFIYRASKIVVNQDLSEDFFDIDFPPGTQIADETV